MGQAKRRGTFEDRHQQAIDEHGAIVAARQAARTAAMKELNDRIEAMTEAERDAYYTQQERRQKRSVRGVLTAMAMLSAAGSTRFGRF